MPQKFALTTEKELYDSVIKVLSPAARFDTDIIREHERDIYVAAEHHQTREPVIYVHEGIVPLIAKEPKRWLMLREGLHSYDDCNEEDLFESHPSHFYFTKLPKLLDIPADDFVGSVLNGDTKTGIIERTSLSEEEIDLWYATNFINTNRQLGREDSIRLLAERMNKPVDYVLNLPWGLLSDSGSAIKLHKRLMTAWNQYGRVRFHQITEQYRDRDSILVSIGAAHLPAISDRYPEIY